MIQNIEKSLADQKFREVMVSLISNAKHKITLITGEFHLYEKFFDVRWAVDNVLKAGVKTRIFLRKPHGIVTYNLLQNDAKVYINHEQQLENHLMAIDESIYMISFPHPEFDIGNRIGCYDLNDPIKVIEIEDMFDNITKNLNNVSDVSYDKHSLIEFYKEPIKLGYKTDASRLDEELI